jgi:hypothetical protein
MRPIHVATAVLALSTTLSLAADFPRFDPVVIDSAAAKKAVYAVALADVDGDSRQDVVSVNENQVVWYRNPDWEKHVILEDQTELDNVCIAPHDIDGDGKIDFALGAGWTKVGTIQWITRGATPEEKWKVHAIAIEPTTHRMRWANVLGNGRSQLVVSPLNAAPGNKGVRLLAFDVPADPRTDPWTSTVLDDTFNRLHNHWHVDLDGDGVYGTLTAGQEGVHVIRRADDGTLQKFKLAGGMPGDKPEEQGSGEVKFGRLANRGMFVATVEPMHGTSVVAYTMAANRQGGPQADRRVLDDTLKQGHAVWAADLDGDGGDEIVAGHREKGDGAVKGPGVYVYKATDEAGTKWTKHVIDDGGMACEDLLCADLNADGKLDIVAGGRATLNVKLYLNRR